MKNYNKQADQFLADTGTTLTIIEAVPQKTPLWAKKGEKHGTHYSVTLENKNHRYTFDFWDSIANKEKNIKPEAYEILACLSPLYEDSFEEFCDSFGYDIDSITAEKTYKACVDQDRNLRKLFTHAEIEKLTEIQ